MAGNMVVSSGGGLLYLKMEPLYQYVSTENKYLYLNGFTASPNEYYDVGRLDFLRLELKTIDVESTDMIMFDFTANRENFTLILNSTTPIYWVKELTEFKIGYKYQFIYFRGIVNWCEIKVE